MRDDLLDYYERELTFLRQMGAEFAEKYPKIASRLLLEPDRCEDPHVERMIEAFAFLAGRVHLKIDDEFPEITEALLGILYPHYIRPIPSMSIVEFHLDPGITYIPEMVFRFQKIAPLPRRETIIPPAPSSGRCARRAWASCRSIRPIRRRRRPKATTTPRRSTKTSSQW
jgi:type VI secretion system protein ImpG